MEEQNTNQTVDQATNEQPGGQDQTQITDTTTETVEEKVFKQEDVNNIVAKETKKVQEKILKGLGIEDFENAKEGMKQFKEWQESQKTEAQRQQEQFEALSKEKESLTSKNQSLEAQLSALKQGVNSDSVEDVVALAERLVNDDVTMDDAIKQVVEKYPHFAGGVEEEEPKPSFTLGQHKKISNGKNDPFADKLAKYQK
ncbi:hypothetical protein [Gracilibacillus dipsosauri]|uniref:Uncharacterized protein n=1 Tax=Gracilibacillus dipsosauri TaxID=178340 RepID=A0A317KTH1_9BACI|nr:hypothetical protein [Gracilibacillus dipsosauri]PWU66573.1 hypothetical protein DLJ74_19315 [Gracilibacillus dipsosauri]